MFQQLGDAARPVLEGRKPLAEQMPDSMNFIRDVVAVEFSKRLAALGVQGEGALSAQERGAADVARLHKYAESPIERAIAPWLIFADYGPQFLTVPARAHCPKEDKRCPAGDLIIVPQYAFLRYRLDFGVVARLNGRFSAVGLECDGEEFHAEVYSDNDRENYFKSWGIPIVRANGKQIYTEPHKVIGRVHEALCRAIEGLV